MTSVGVFHAWSPGHNSTMHNGFSRIGFYTVGHAAGVRDEDLADKWVEKSEEWISVNKETTLFSVAIPDNACLDGLDVMGALLGQDRAEGRARG